MKLSKKLDRGWKDVVWDRYDQYALHNHMKLSKDILL